jgi:hypothetical protein
MQKAYFVYLKPGCPKITRHTCTLQIVLSLFLDVKHLEHIPADLQDLIPGEMCMLLVDMKHA